MRRLTAGETDFEKWYKAEQAAELARRDAINRERGLPETLVKLDRIFDPDVIKARFKRGQYYHEWTKYEG
jgi:hypothetical protein